MSRLRHAVHTHGCLLGLSPGRVLLPSSTRKRRVDHYSTLNVSVARPLPNSTRNQAVTEIWIAYGPLARLTLDKCMVHHTKLLDKSKRKGPNNGRHQRQWKQLSVWSRRPNQLNHRTALKISTADLTHTRVLLRRTLPSVTGLLQSVEQT
jgi:hypothetical protein